MIIFSILRAKIFASLCAQLNNSPTFAVVLSKVTMASTASWWALQSWCFWKQPQHSSSLNTLLIFKKHDNSKVKKIVELTNVDDVLWLLIILLSFSFHYTCVTINNILSFVIMKKWPQAESATLEWICHFLTKCSLWSPDTGSLIRCDWQIQYCRFSAIFKLLPCMCTTHVGDSLQVLINDVWSQN